MSKHTDKYDDLIEKMGGLGEVFHLVPFTTYAIKEAIEKGDEFLNTLPLEKWDDACGGIQCSNRHNWPIHTLAERVCIHRMVDSE